MDAWTQHSFNIGGEFRRERDNGTGVTSIGPSGAYNFNAGTALPEALTPLNGGPGLPAGTPSPSGLISMMEGADVNFGRATTVPGYGPPGGGEVWWGLRRWTLAGYLQDDYKISRRLTLNLGVRYEYASVPTEVGNRFAGPADYGSLYGHFVVNPQPLWKPDYFSGNLVPRVGMALNLGSGTVLRGGFAMFTNMIPTVYPDQALVNFPVASLNYLANAPYSLTPQAVSLPVLTSTTGAPIAANGNSKTVPPNTPMNIAPYAKILGVLGGDYPSDGLRNGYTISGNVTLEHEFKGGIAGQASYIANNGVALYNQTYPNAFQRRRIAVHALQQYHTWIGRAAGVLQRRPFHLQRLAVPGAQDFAHAWPAVSGQLHVCKRHDGRGCGVEFRRGERWYQPEQSAVRALRARAGQLQHCAAVCGQLRVRHSAGFGADQSSEAA